MIQKRSQIIQLRNSASKIQFLQICFLFRYFHFELISTTKIKSSKSLEGIESVPYLHLDLIKVT
jgi:hypothetical protein